MPTCRQKAAQVAAEHIKNIHALIERLTHYKRSLKDTAKVRTREEWQAWNIGLKQIGGISFTHLRKNQKRIAAQLSDVWRGNYFEYN